MSEKICVINQKGGTGKTTTAVNLAAAIAELGKRVLLADIDPQGNATTGVGVDKRKIARGTYQVLTGEAKIKDAIVRTATEKLDLLPTNANQAGAEIEIAGKDGWQKLLMNALAEIDSDYDFVFLDCPPALGLFTLNALTAADGTLIPTQCEYYSLEGLSDLADTMARLRKSLNPRLKVEGVLRTMYDPRSLLANQVSAELERHFGASLYKTVIPRNVRLAEAPSHGMPAISFSGSARGARAYRDLAEEFMERRQ